MNYQEEKEYLNAIVTKYLSNCAGMCHSFRHNGINNDGKPITINGPIIPLYYFGDSVNTELVSIFINEFNEVQVEYYIPNEMQDTEYDMFMEYSNDEMKLVIEKMGLNIDDFDYSYKYLGFFTKEMTEQILEVEEYDLDGEYLFNMYKECKDNVFNFKKAIGESVLTIQDACCGVKPLFFEDYLFTIDNDYINVYKLY